LGNAQEDFPDLTTEAILNNVNTDYSLGKYNSISIGVMVAL
jgi:hypothetical protein